MFTIETFVIDSQTYKVVEVSIDDSIVLGCVDRQSSAGIGHHRHGCSPKGGQNDGCDTFKLGSDDVYREQGTQMHQYHDSGNGKRESRTENGPSCIGVGVFLSIFLQSDVCVRKKRKAVMRDIQTVPEVFEGIIMMQICCGSRKYCQRNMRCDVLHQKLTTDTALPIVMVANAKKATHRVKRGLRPLLITSPVSWSIFMLNINC